MSEPKSYEPFILLATRITSAAADMMEEIGFLTGVRHCSVPHIHDPHQMSDLRRAIAKAQAAIDHYDSCMALGREELTGAEFDALPRVKAAEEIAERYGYDQVVIIARKVDQPAGVGENAKDEIKGGEHVTTYGRNKEHCGVAAQIGDFFKHKLMGWPVPACKHEFAYAGVRYCEGTWPLPGGSARQRYYAHVYFCSKCTETKGEKIEDAGSFGRPRFDTFQKLEFSAVPGTPDQCGVPQRDR